MPKDFRKFKREIEQAGYFIRQTRSGHYSVETKDGEFLEGFAVSHGKRTRGGEVWDSYVRLVFRAIAHHKQQ